MGAQRAYELGIVSEVVEPDRLHGTAQALAATKRALWGSQEELGARR
jgi:enoyl-CoA hydratase/carnithine racemase